MRIWLVPSAFHPSRGGVEELTLQLAREYQRVGHEAIVLVHRNPSDLPTTDEVEGVPIRRLTMDLPGRDPRRLLGYPLALLRQVHALTRVARPPDVIHVQCPANQVLPMCVYARRHRVPLIISTQGEVTMDADAVYEASALMRLSLRLGSRAATSLTACSRRAGDDAATVAPAFTGCPVIPNGVDVDQWQVSPLPARPVFAAWGRHVEQKGFDLLIRAFAEVRRDLPGAVLRIGGDGERTAELRALAGPGVEFLGALDRHGVQDLLTGARVAVVPSRLEPFGIVAVEAMAAGRTVVWSTNGGLADATGDLGRGVDPTDLSAMAKAMVEVSHTPLPPAAARAHAETLTWTSIGRRYLDLYSGLVRSSHV
ncbi:glycosyltransferase family 4 protein [Janibacter sp. GS2]|uniref:glycosyltransferase family 4 protein n=1 Tax=Janibacter sp. GS2 TaxID=3442646 RepID=UPI003EBC1631